MARHHIMATKFGFKVELVPSVPHAQNAETRLTTCTKCRNPIRDKMRVASMAQVNYHYFLNQGNRIAIFFHFLKSEKEDALEPEWYHMDCLFSYDIAFLDHTSFDGFAALNNTDKQFFKQRMGKFYI